MAAWFSSSRPLRLIDVSPNGVASRGSTPSGRERPRPSSSRVYLTLAHLSVEVLVRRADSLEEDTEPCACERLKS